MANGYSVVTFRDYDNEASVVRVKQTTLTAANFDAQAALRGAYEAALTNMTTIDTLNAYAYGNEQINSTVGDDSKLSQRESKWRVDYHETANPNVRGHFTIPCADLTLLDANNKGMAEIGDAGPVDAFVAAAEAFVLSDNGLAITIDQIVHVGRNT